MQINYDKLFLLLKDKNISQRKIKEKLNFSNGIFDNLRHNKSVTMETIGKICEYLRVQPSDIVEIIYDDNNAEKAKIEQQIAALQEKLKNM